MNIDGRQGRQTLWRQQQLQQYHVMMKGGYFQDENEHIPPQQGHSQETHSRSVCNAEKIARTMSDSCLCSFSPQKKYLVLTTADIGSKIAATGRCSTSKFPCVPSIPAFCFLSVLSISAVEPSNCTTLLFLSICCSKNPKNGFPAEGKNEYLLCDSNARYPVCETGVLTT